MSKILGDKILISQIKKPWRLVIQWTRDTTGIVSYMYIGIWLWLIEGSVFPQMIKPFLSVLLISFLFCCLLGQKGGSEVSFGSGKLPGDNIKWQYISFFFFLLIFFTHLSFIYYYYYYYYFLLYNIVLVLPYINMNPPQVFPIYSLLNTIPSTFHEGNNLDSDSLSNLQFILHCQQFVLSKTPV